jgi:hypothetical protein
MKARTRFFIAMAVALMFVVGVTGTTLAFDSGGKPTGSGPDTITWTGQGSLGDPAEYCPSLDTVPAGIDPNSYLHWIVTTDGGSADSATLHLGGTGGGNYTGTLTGGAFHFFTPYFNLSGLTAYADINILTTGNGAWGITISHGCAGTTDYEELTVTKTVETSYTRTHEWSIAKSVDLTDLYLYIPGQDGKSSTGVATWTVDVTYEGYQDSDWNVSGDITIENTGTLDAVIASIDDVLAGTSISVDCGVTFPYTLDMDTTLTCSYSEDGYVEGVNYATVTTGRDEYSSSEIPIAWGDPTTEINKTVHVKDISNLFGEVALGTVTAPNNDQFTYTQDFYWVDYQDAACGNHTYNNTATIDETGDSASAALTVHVQCHIFTTAYGKGDNPTCFIPTFSNWGWTNFLAGNTAQTLDMWAGAGQCDTSKGTLIGTVTVVYGADGYVTVTYIVSMPYVIQDTHVYAGSAKFPKVLLGKKLVDTVAPGQYYNSSPLSGPIYVIAHAVVGIPDPNFP